MSNISSVLSILFLISQGLLLVSCSKITSNPPVGVDDGYVNQQILLRAPDFSNSFNTTDRISLELKYNSTNEIIFPNNFGLRIFQWKNQEWVELHEKPITRLPVGDVVFSLTKAMPAVHVIYLSPDLQEPTLEYQLRIYVIGDMNMNDEIIKVAAYTDIILHP